MMTGWTSHPSAIEMRWRKFFEGLVILPRLVLRRSSAGLSTGGCGLMQQSSTWPTSLIKIVSKPPFLRLLPAWTLNLRMCFQKWDAYLRSVTAFWTATPSSLLRISGAGCWKKSLPSTCPMPKGYSVLSCWPPHKPLLVNGLLRRSLNSGRP